MENDLISRSALIGKSISVGVCDAQDTFYGCGEVVLIDDIKAAPAVDAVPVVRCKDCKWHRMYSDFVIDCARDHGMVYVSPNDFCSYGERKD